jgi:hypothetical protein
VQSLICKNKILFENISNNIKQICFKRLFSLFCVLCPMLLVSLDCSFLIAPSFFSNKYSKHICRVEIVSIHGEIINREREIVNREVEIVNREGQIVNR